MTERRRLWTRCVRAMPKAALRGIAGLGLSVALAACSQDGPRPAARQLTVFAASSLGDAFTDLEAAFERAHPAVDVVVSTAGSQVVRTQIAHGAPADVVATANRAHMDALHAAGHTAPAAVFAHTTLAVVVPKDSPLTALADLPRAARIVLGAPAVPVGAYAQALLARADGAYGPGFAARVRARVVSTEPNARLVRAKVALGAADAAIVYAADVPGAAGLRALPVPDALNVQATAMLATTTRAAQPDADAFVAFVQSAAGQALLAARGFTAPTGAQP